MVFHMTKYGSNVKINPWVGSFKATTKHHVSTTTTRRLSCHSPVKPKWFGKLHAFYDCFFANHKILATKKKQKGKIYLNCLNPAELLWLLTIWIQDTLSSKSNHSQLEKRHQDLVDRRHLALYYLGYSVFERFYRFGLIARIQVQAVMPLWFSSVSERNGFDCWNFHTLSYWLVGKLWLVWKAVVYWRRA